MTQPQPPLPGTLWLDTWRATEVALLDAAAIGAVWRLELRDAATGSDSVWVDTPSAFAERFAPVAPTEDPVPSATAPFSADPEIVRNVVEAYRLRHAYLFSPFFATETALIDPLPHQYVAVYDHMLQQSPLRFLLADDAGAGKTIMAGLYMREALQRRSVRRILVLAPAGLVGNWESELRRLFQLRFHILRREDLGGGGDAAGGPNPFAAPDLDFCVASIDTAARDRCKRALLDAPAYDLVVFDEAHKLSASRDADMTARKSRRYELAEAIAAQGRNLLLLTATPHMGKDDPYFYLWRLLDPLVFTTPGVLDIIPAEVRDRHMIRRLKEGMVDFKGRPIYTERWSATASYPLTKGEDSEHELYDAVTDYCHKYFGKAASRNRQAAALAMTVLQRRLASSTWALLRSMQNRRRKLEAQLEDLRRGRLTTERWQQQQLSLPASDLRAIVDSADEETDGGEENEQSDRDLEAATTAETATELEAEAAEVARLEALAQRVYDKHTESKFAELEKAIAEHPGEKILIFTEHRDTADFLTGRLEAIGFSGQVARIDGSLDYLEREAQVARFRGEPLPSQAVETNEAGAPQAATRVAADPGVRFLVATDAAGEGVNLQFCRVMINYDVPWNPARIEQRMGRIHRYGQKHDVVLINLLAQGTRDGRVLEVLLDKLETMRLRLESDRVFNVIGECFEGETLSGLIQQAVLEGNVEAAMRAVEERTDRVPAAVARQQDPAYQQQVAALLPALRGRTERAEAERILPVYVTNFATFAARHLGLTVEGDPTGAFSLAGLHGGGAAEAVRLALLAHPEALRRRLTFYRGQAAPAAPGGSAAAIHLHPGEPVYEALATAFLERFGALAQGGGLFVDGRATQPAFFALLRVTVTCDQGVGGWGDVRAEDVAERVVGVRCGPDGAFGEVAAHLLLDLDARPPEADGADAVGDGSDTVEIHTLEKLAEPERLREWGHRVVGDRLLGDVRDEWIRRDTGRRDQLIQAANLRRAELLEQHDRLWQALQRGQRWKSAELHRCRQELDALDGRRDRASAQMEAETASLRVERVEVLARALILPGVTPAVGLSLKEVEDAAMAAARRHEEAEGAVVEDVSDPVRKKGYDLVSYRSDGTVRYIECKGRTGFGGSIELLGNEAPQAQHLGEKYWLFVLEGVGSGGERPRWIQDPVGTGRVVPIGGWRVRVGEG